MYWRIQKDSYHIGEIQFNPYFTEIPHEEPETVDGFLYASLHDETPNGFRIETLPEVPAEYPVASGATVLLLVPPHYTSHGVDFMPSLKDFVVNYNYRDYFYNYIAGADGEIKMILQSYVP